MLLANAQSVETDVRDVQINGATVEVHRQHVIAVQPVDPSALGVAPASRLAALLKTAGGSSAMVVDGSSAAVAFDYVVPAGSAAWLRDLQLTLRCPGATGAAQFGAAAALANGLVAQVIDDNGTTVLATLWEAPIKTNTGAAAAGGEVAAPLANVLTWWWALDLALAAGQRLRVTVADNITVGHATEITALVTGRVAEVA